MTEAQAQEIVKYFEEQAQYEKYAIVCMAILMGIILLWIATTIFKLWVTNKWYKNWKGNLTDKQLNAIKERRKFD